MRTYKKMCLHKKQYVYKYKPALYEALSIYDLYESGYIRERQKNKSYW